MIFRDGMQKIGYCTTTFKNEKNFWPGFSLAPSVMKIRKEARMWKEEKVKVFYGP